MKLKEYIEAKGMQLVEVTVDNEMLHIMLTNGTLFGVATVYIDVLAHGDSVAQRALRGELDGVIMQMRAQSKIPPGGQNVQIGAPCLVHEGGQVEFVAYGKEYVCCEVDKRRHVHAWPDNAYVIHGENAHHCPAEPQVDNESAATGNP